MKYAITEQLVTGNAQIDRQHQQMVEALNLLLDCCDNNDGPYECMRAFEMLQTAADKHIATEEALQIGIAYPNIDLHRSQHVQFKRSLNFLHDQLRHLGNATNISSSISQRLADPIMRHIRTEDMALAKFIKENS